MTLGYTISKKLCYLYCSVPLFLSLGYICTDKKIKDTSDFFFAKVYIKNALNFIKTLKDGAVYASFLFSVK